MASEYTQNLKTPKAVISTSSLRALSEQVAKYEHSNWSRHTF